MGYIEGHSRDQMLLLPASVDDYVAADNPVRFIAAFVDDLDLGELGFDRSRPRATGRPGYAPADLLKLYLYGYLNRVRSSRCLAAETARMQFRLCVCAGWSSSPQLGVAPALGKARKRTSAMEIANGLIVAHPLIRRFLRSGIA